MEPVISVQQALIEALLCINHRGLQQKYKDVSEKTPAFKEFKSRENDLTEGHFSN